MFFSFLICLDAVPEDTSEWKPETAPQALVTTGLDLGNTLQLVFAVLLLILGVLVAIQGVKKLLEKTDDKKATA